MANLALWLILVYAAIVILGGFLGYRRAGSNVSLISGIISGVLLLVTFGVGLSNLQFGLLLAAVIAVALFVVFLTRFRRTSKFMPSGLMMGISILMGILYLVGLVAAIVSPPV